MTPERWKEIEAVLQGALDRPLTERNAFLDDACAGDRQLRDEAGSLITAYEEAGDFIEQPAIAQDARVVLDDIEGQIDREFGPYRIIDRLGAGGMGEVYLAQDTRLGRLVALKLLPAYFAADNARLRRFQSEARAASALNHPNILTIHEVGENAGVHFIATEFIDGQTISELIKTQELSVDNVLDIVEQVASALSAAHAAGIVHRDIKPENIMRRSDGLVKILDFGIAKLVESETSDDQTAAQRTHTEAGLVMGTANYMSPEQARALPVDERTDIWSLGVVLYEMLARRRPFSGATRMDTMVAILERQPAPLSEVATEHYPSAPLLQSIVDKCLRKDLDDRYRTVGELLVDLKEVRQQMDRPRARFAWSFVAVALLVVVAAVSVYLYRRAVRPSVTPVTVEATTPSAKPYTQMSEAEQFDFVSTQAQRISTMMGDRPSKLDQDSVQAIKLHVDRYLSRNNDGNLGAVYERAQPYVPSIARSFAARKVPVIIGIYLPVIESSYRNICTSDGGRGKGLFQLTVPTAESYGVSREDMCDVEKMTPVAAQYLADHMAELGEDAESVTLVLLSYNHGAEWVRESLRQLRGTQNYERNFWTLLAHREMLDENFRHEGAGYVPAFFAAAIIGENPTTFSLRSPPLSTLASER